MTTAIESPTFRPTLRIGDRGQDVKEMQKLLEKRFASIYKSRFKINVDGDFGLKTEAAVKYLQCIAFLDITGITDAATWNFICNGVKSLGVLQCNNSGNKVKFVQQTLLDGGFYHGAIDGHFDTHTQIAVKAFQANYSLVADGIIGEKTWDLLIQLDSHIDACYCYYYGGC